jgi:N-acetylglucosaminyl-diphospho-decaprenol L-rhamnosyltransferase
VGGFDEGYFMFAEDVDLCWRVRATGTGVGFVDAATVVHVEGASRAKHPYAMLVAHHRSALRFADTSTTGASRILLPGAAIVLGLRLVVALARTALERRRPANS